MGEAVSTCTNSRDSEEIDMNQIKKEQKEADKQDMARSTAPIDLTADEKSLKKQIEYYTQKFNSLTDENKVLKERVDYLEGELSQARKEIKGYQRTLKEYTVNERKAQGENMDEAKVVVQEIDEAELKMLEEQQKSQEKQKSPSPKKEAQSHRSPSPAQISPDQDKEQSLKSHDLPQHESETGTPQKEIDVVQDVQQQEQPAQQEVAPEEGQEQEETKEEQ